MDRGRTSGFKALIEAALTDVKTEADLRDKSFSVTLWLPDAERGISPVPTLRILPLLNDL